MSFILYDEQHIKSEIEKQCCPIHGKHPIFTNTTKGFRLETCCEEFGDICEILAKALIETELNAAIQRHVMERLGE